MISTIPPSTAAVTPYPDFDSSALSWVVNSSSISSSSQLSCIFKPDARAQIGKYCGCSIRREEWNTCIRGRRVIATTWSASNVLGSFPRMNDDNSLKRSRSQLPIFSPLKSSPLPDLDKWTYLPLLAVLCILIVLIPLTRFELLEFVVLLDRLDGGGWRRRGRIGRWSRGDVLGIFPGHVCLFRL